MRYTRPRRDGVPNVERFNAVCARWRRLMARRGLHARIALWYYDLPPLTRELVESLPWVILIVGTLALIYAPN